MLKTAKIARKSPNTLTNWAIHKRFTAGVLSTSPKPRVDVGLAMLD
jgi:hypothetical protein